VTLDGYRVTKMIRPVVVGYYTLEMGKCDVMTFGRSRRLPKVWPASQNACRTSVEGCLPGKTFQNTVFTYKKYATNIQFVCLCITTFAMNRPKC